MSFADFFDDLKGAKTRNDAADVYRRALEHLDHLHPLWAEANQIILRRWSRAGLMYVKQRAWAAGGAR